MSRLRPPTVSVHEGSLAGKIRSVTTNVSGLDLKLLRLSRRLRQRDVAVHYGADRSRVALVESQAAPSDRSVSRYLAAVDAAARDR